MLRRLLECLSAYGWRCLSTTWSDSNARYQIACARGHAFERIAATLLHRTSAPKCAECEAEDLRALVRHRQCTGRRTRRGRLHWPAAALPAAVCRRARVGGVRPQNRRRQLVSGVRQGRTSRAKPPRGRIGATARRGRGQGRPVSADRLHDRSTQVSIRIRTRSPVGSRGTRSPARTLVRPLREAREQGGQCLATEYRGSTEKYWFRCAAGHEWQAVASQIWLGHWCRQCANLKLRNSIEDMQALAATRGGLCLSAEYHGKGVRLTWQCHHGHVWESRPVNVGAGKWCPQCAILDRVRAKNNWKRKRYEVLGRLPE